MSLPKISTRIWSITSLSSLETTPYPIGLGLSLEDPLKFSLKNIVEGIFHEERVMVKVIQVVCGVRSRVRHRFHSSRINKLFGKVDNFQKNK